MIPVDAPLAGFLDGIVMDNRTLYILTPFGAAPGDGIQVVDLDVDLQSGTLAQIITDPDIDGVASGAIFGNSLYVNNARYLDFPADTFFLTKLPLARGR